MERQLPKMYQGKCNLTKLIVDRQNSDIEQIIRNRLHTTREFIERLELEKELVGHTGCVNCLEWSSDGRLLASGSDDYHVLLWDPFRHKQLRDLPTPHRGNIFSVKFMPMTDNSTILTGAGDFRIYGFDVNQVDPIFKCNCHNNRVKRLAVAPENKHLFWSSSEDGRVFQFDLREPHKCGDHESKQVLINLSNHTGTYFTEVKCIAINPRRPELLAIGAYDAYARLYDRRMIKLDKIRTVPEQQSSINRTVEFYVDNIPKGCVAYFAPGHMQLSHSSSQSAATYITFSPDGQELLVNIGAEQIYIYNIYDTHHPILMELPPHVTSGENHRSNLQISDKTEELKTKGNSLLDQEKHTDAIAQYNDALQLSPTYPALYLNRATALMRRKWRGDLYQALRDCKKALKLNSCYVKAHFRMVRVLLEMEYLQEAKDCLGEMKRRFPDHITNHGVLMLERDLNKAFEDKKINESDTETSVLSDNEMYWRSVAVDYQERFVGHCNTKTDIKEANYFGKDGRYIVAGSDDGNIFLWERPTGNLVEVLVGDKSIVNCVQPHPFICLLATSGIDHEVRLWSPQPLEGYEHKHKVLERTNLADNQQRMIADPFGMNEFPNAVCRTS